MFFPGEEKEIEKYQLPFTWDVKKVWKLQLPVEAMEMKELEWHLSLPYWSTPGNFRDIRPIDIIEDPENKRDEFARIMNSDLSHPIDIIEHKGRWMILDGLHRLSKLKVLGKKTVQVRKIPWDKVDDIKIFQNEKKRE